MLHRIFAIIYKSLAFTVQYLRMFSIFFAIFRVCSRLSLHERRFTQLQLFFPLHGVSIIEMQHVYWRFGLVIYFSGNLGILHWSFSSREIEEFWIVCVWWNFRRNLLMAAPDALQSYISWCFPQILSQGSYFFLRKQNSHQEGIAPWMCWDFQRILVNYQLPRLLRNCTFHRNWLISYLAFRFNVQDFICQQSLEHWKY